MSNHRTQGRPPLEWQVAGVFVGPEPVVPDKAPEFVKAKARRYAACQVSVASAGFDHKNQVDRLKFSHKLGWLDPETQRFEPITNLPDERVAEFVVALQKAAAEAKIVHANSMKKVKGQLAASISEQMKGAKYR